jgi:exodeoxyribonuclease VII large subunit
MRLEDLTDRLAARFREKMERQKERLNWERHRLRVKAPTDLAGQLAAKLERCRVALLDVARRRTGVERMRTEALQGRLETLSPMVVLKRGYSITQTVPEAEIVRNAGQVAVGQALDVRVAVGVIRCRVEERFDIDDETDV